MQNFKVTITAKGRELASKLNPSIGTTRDVLWICSRICRLAVTYCGLQELACNGYRHSGQQDVAEAKERDLEARIAALCDQLPHVDGKPIVPKFSGDPRGATVKLVMPDGRADDWGQEGLCVPGS